MANSLKWHEDESRLLKGKTQRLEADEKLIERKVDEAETKVSALERDMKALERQIDDAKKALSALRTDSAHKAEEISSLSTKIAENDRIIAELRKEGSSQRG